MTQAALLRFPRKSYRRFEAPAPASQRLPRETSQFDAHHPKPFPVIRFGTHRSFSLIDWDSIPMFLRSVAPSMRAEAALQVEKEGEVLQCNNPLA